MLTDDAIQHVRPRLLVMQILPVAMLGGAVMFAIAIGTMADWSVIGRPIKIFNLIAAVTAIAFYLLAFVIPAMFPRFPDNLPRPSAGAPDAGQTGKFLDGMVGLLTTETITRAALLEGGVLLNLVVLMLEARWLTVAAAGLGMMLMLATIPLKFRIVNRLKDRYDEWSR